MAESGWARSLSLYHARVWQQDFSPGGADRCQQRGWGVELGAHAAGVDRERSGAADQFEVFWQARAGRVERDAASRGSLWTEVGVCARSLLRPAAGVCRLA